MRGTLRYLLLIGAAISTVISWAEDDEVKKVGWQVRTVGLLVVFGILEP